MKLSKLFRTLDSRYRSEYSNRPVYTPKTNNQAALNTIERIEEYGLSAKIITCVSTNQYNVDIYLDKLLLGRVVTSSRSACTFYVHDNKRMVSSDVVNRMIEGFVSSELIKAYAEAIIVLFLYNRSLEDKHLLVRKTDWVWYENSYWYSIYPKNFKRKVGVKGVIAKLKLDGYDFLNPDIIPQLIENEQKKAQSRSVKRK